MVDGLGGPGTWSLDTSPLSNYVTYDEYISGLRRRADVLREFENYTAPNWDGEGAEPVLSTVIRRAEALLSHVPTHIPPPSAAPGADGTIGLDWENDRGVVCIDVSDEPDVRYFFELGEHLKKEGGGDPSSVEFLDQLSRALVTLYPSRRVRLRIVRRTDQDLDSSRETNAPNVVRSVA